MWRGVEEEESKTGYATRRCASGPMNMQEHLVNLSEVRTPSRTLGPQMETLTQVFKPFIVSKENTNGQHRRIPVLLLYGRQAIVR